MSFGSRLKELRIERNSSQKEIADDIGISITAISQYESDSRFPNEDILKRLCLYYNVSSDYLLELTDTKCSIPNNDYEKYTKSQKLDMLYDLIKIIESE